MGKRGPHSRVPSVLTLPDVDVITRQSAVEAAYIISVAMMIGLVSSALAFQLGGFRGRGRSAEATMMAGITQGKVHGEGGAYVGGYWVPLSECDNKFNIKGGSNEKTAATPCPRSITRHSAAKPDGTYDVVIIHRCRLHWLGGRS